MKFEYSLSVPRVDAHGDQIRLADARFDDSQLRVDDVAVVDRVDVVLNDLEILRI